MFSNIVLFAGFLQKSMPEKSSQNISMSDTKKKDYKQKASNIRMSMVFVLWYFTQIHTLI